MRLYFPDDKRRLMLFGFLEMTAKAFRDKGPWAGVMGIADELIVKKKLGGNEALKILYHHLGEWYGRSD